MVALAIEDIVVDVEGDWDMVVVIGKDNNVVLVAIAVDVDVVEDAFGSSICQDAVVAEEGHCIVVIVPGIDTDVKVDDTTVVVA
eukprot:Awhi_evm1s13135